MSGAGAMMDVKVTRLPNGVTVATANMPHVQSVSLGIWSHVGSRHESREVAGVSHFIEHLLFKGSAKRSTRQITQAIEGRGGYLNAFTQEESTCYFARVTHDRFAEAFDVLADMVLHPRFDPKDLEKERGVIVEEIMMYRDQPHHVVQEMLTQALWKGHPAGRPVIGTVETVTGVSREQVAAYHERHYGPECLVCTFAGRVDHDACVDEVTRVMGEVAKRTRPRPRRVTERTAQRPAWVRKKAVEQSHLCLGLRLFGYPDARRYPLKILNVVLGENMSSRLFHVVREQRGMAYAIHSMIHMMRDCGALVVSAGLDRTRTLPAAELIVREIRKLKEKPIGVREFARARDYVQGQMRISLESTNNQMMWLGNNLLAHGRVIPPEEALAAVRTATPASVQALAGDVLEARRASMCVVSPDMAGSDEPDLAAILEQL